MSAPIFYVDTEHVEGLEPDEVFRLQGEEGHHAKNVKRLTVGESVDIADGQGLRLSTRVVEVLEDGLVLSIDSIQRETPGSSIILVQALAKNDRDLLAIETATELGVTAVVPWSAHRSIVQWKKERAQKAYGKWVNTVTAAAKQARRASIPVVYDLHNTNQLAKVIDEETAEGALVFVLHEAGSSDLVSFLSKNQNAAGRLIYLVVGPEGGISDQELQLFEEAGAKVVVLGREILRSSTAGAAAITVIKTVFGHW
ncbi:MAG: 16S rRNA (uracil(1498)-N(3))-methyltransferase [Rothia sp. (in: high G+C Gram-positive bacteria)]|nr:16S rRNA (uracil(1498)-N(3))-methyltransferase [Rothia sp. (in: high G+C Gram-positive bacteria)]